MTQEEIITFIESRKDEIDYYNKDAEGRFAVRVLNRLIEDLKERI